jgi:hypothetical protein
MASASAIRWYSVSCYDEVVYAEIKPNTHCRLYPLESHHRRELEESQHHGNDTQLSDH